MNDTKGPSGLVPSYLVFRMLPRYPALNTQLPMQQERMRAVKTARSEMASVTVELWIKQALLSRPPAASSVVYAPGYMVSIYMEVNKKLIGPFSVVRVEYKDVYGDHDGWLAHYNDTQALPEANFSGDSMMEDVTDSISAFRAPREVRSEDETSREHRSVQDATGMTVGPSATL